MNLFAFICGLGLVFCGVPVEGEDAMERLFDTPQDLSEDIPVHFSRFYFESDQEAAQWLSRYLWYHYYHRLGHNPAPFNKEYLSTSDVWMGGAFRSDWGMTAQEAMRENLSQIRIDPDGYIWTHQHFSHAHETGWPFPMWVQGGDKAVGWHFQHQGFGWAWDHYLNHHPDSPFGRERAMEGWTLDNLTSEGITENAWRLLVTGSAPAMTTPPVRTIDAFNAPFIQIRFSRSDKGNRPPYIEWLREGDESFGPDRRVSFDPKLGNPEYEQITGRRHMMALMHEHSKWDGPITRMRVVFPDAGPGTILDIDSIFTVYDTRHSINNPIYILSCWRYFTWTGDVDFLKKVIGQMRRALDYQRTTMGGVELGFIRNPWPGHDGKAGFTVHEDGSKTIHYGHGIGNNYWDLLPFGGDDMYSTAQYYASTLVMADIEEAILLHSEWSIPDDGPVFDPDDLRAHAARVKENANTKFWNPETGRFYACFDTDGNAHDYGLTFLNLDAIWYGIANEENTASIMAWINGDRIIEGDTSVGEDIYHWRFGPRATTLRNIEWYGWVWSAPESIPWGGQVQDGGAVLGFTFYDLWARLHTLGPENAWKRLLDIIEWEKEVWAEGGYRPYYADGKRGTTLQGGGTAGGLGIDFEFFESSLLPSIVTYGFLGLDAKGSGLFINPNLPEMCPSIGIANLWFRGVRLDLHAKRDGVVEVMLQDEPKQQIRLLFNTDMTYQESGNVDKSFILDVPGRYAFRPVR